MMAEAPNIMAYLRMATEGLQALDPSYPAGETFAGFLLREGQVFEVDDKTYAGRRMQAQHCFENAALTMQVTDLLYAEGYVTVCGVPIHHAWNVDAKGRVRDRTLQIGSGGHEYFGVAFDPKFVTHGMFVNRYYGLLDPAFNKHTAIPLFKGEAQDWKPNVRHPHRRSDRRSAPRDRHA